MRPQNASSRSRKAEPAPTKESERWRGTNPHNERVSKGRCSAIQPTRFGCRDLNSSQSPSLGAQQWNYLASSIQATKASNTEAAFDRFQRRCVLQARSRRFTGPAALIHFGSTSGPFVMIFESTMPISTRRLAARAWSLSPRTRGSDLPNPLALMIVGEIPACTRKSRTASARRCESCKLYVCVPMSSVYP